MTQTPGVAPATDELPFPPAPIEDLLRLFVKAVKAQNLYLPNNPMHKAAVDATRAGFAPIWQQTDELALTFSEADIKWMGRPVLVEQSKVGDSLPWMFFKDGIREVRLHQGFEEVELPRLFEILHRLRKAAPEADDLLTMLWEADFAHLRYRYVDLGAEQVGTLDGAGADQAPATPDAVRAAMHQHSPQSENAIVNMQDFDSTLYFLDDKELEYLRAEIDREYAGDLRRNIVALLLDIFEQQTAPAVRQEVCELLESMMLLMLAAGQLQSVAYLLRETQFAVARGADVSPAHRDRLGKMSDRLSAAEPLGQLLQALDESADLPTEEDLVALVGELRPMALATIFAWLPRLKNAKVRELMESAADRLSAAHTPEFVKLVSSPDRPVALQAIRRSGAMKAIPAVLPLGKALGEGDQGVRLAAAQALANVGTPGALHALERAIDDADRDVRIAAVRALGAKKYRGVLTRLETAVKGKKLKEADLTERMAFFEAYGAICGDPGIPYLDGILNGTSMFGKHQDPESRACAAVALGKVGTAKALASLQQSAGEKDVVVRNAVTRALKGGGHSE